MLLPPYLGNKAGWILMTLLGNSFKIKSGNFHKKPANTIKSGLFAFKSCNTLSVLEKAILLKDIALTSKSLARSRTDRKSTRLNSSHVRISYAVFCLKKKK